MLLNVNLNDRMYFKMRTPGYNAIMRRHHELGVDPPRALIQSDVDGYCNALLWELMEHFGAVTGAGMNPPIEPSIKIEVKGKTCRACGQPILLPGYRYCPNCAARVEEP